MNKEKIINRHCEERSDEAISKFKIASSARCKIRPPRNDGAVFVKATLVLFTILPLVLILLSNNAVSAQRPTDIIGEAFGKPVTAEEFHYYYVTASIFTRLGVEEREDEEVRLEAWQNLIYRHDARDLGITVTRETLEAELKRLMAVKEIEYGTQSYGSWISNNLGESTKDFEKRIEDLLIINEFLKYKSNPEITVTEDEMLQKFKNQYNSFEVEYIAFDTREEAEEFAKAIKKDPKPWKAEWDKKKPLGQKGASWINMMSMEAQIDLWKIPKDDAYNILGSELGDFIVSEYYYGIAVFRLLQKKTADMEKYDDKKKEYYRSSMTKYKRRRIVKEYFEDLLERADYKDLVAEEKQNKKVEALKKKSLIALETNRGIITVKLFPDIAPFASENFIGLVERGYYDGLIFHRVIKDFMIQGGDPTGTGTGGDSIWEQPFIDEVTDDLLFDKPGLLAMANSGKNTNKSQFFITVKEADWLNKKHTIFGEVVSGLEAVLKIADAPVDKKKKPKEEEKIIKAYIK